ncbi:MAG: relaxase domain-containing protein [Lewinellaceae bacterium]|nr:relaxase domain-containing protein [Lewinellaceae bacterium]
MIRIVQTKNAAGAAKYFEEGLQRGDYYATKEQSVGEWGGLAAQRLGLSGDVAKDDFVALCHNQKPDGSRLNPRHSEERKVGWDFSFSVPKSVSTFYAITGDERIRQAFEQSVEETMREIERNARTPVGQGKDKELVTTGEMVWAGFTHKTSRPVDGVPDPQLHRHVFVMNTTWNEDKQRFQAMEIRPIKQIAPYYEAAFHARMADKMKKLGYSIQRKVDSQGRYGWELEGIDASTLVKFSRRTSLIEHIAAEQKAKQGHITAKQKAQLGALTREKKLVGHSYDKLREVWQSRLTEEESDAMMRAHVHPFAGEKKKPVTAREAVERSSRHLFERKSAVKEYQLKAEALKRGYGDILPQEVEDATAEAGFHRKQLGETVYITTEEAVRDEHKMLAHIRRGKGTQLPLNARYQPKNPLLNEEQKAAVKHALTDPNNVTIIAGGAGTGKTTLMKEVAAGIEAGGTKIFGFAPSAAASRGVMREEGFEQADTLAQLLHNPKLQEQTKNSVIWVDEAGLIGTRDMNKLFEVAERQKARILLTGDVKQHSSVAAGDALRILEQEGGIKAVRVHKIQRQRSNFSYKSAVALAGKGQVDTALHQLDRMGWVKEIGEGRHRLTMLVTDYADTVKDGKSALIVSPTHIEGQSVTDTLRQKLKYDGLLQEQERTFLQLKSCNWTEEAKADSVQYNQNGQKLSLEFHQNAKGYRKGERFEVESGKGENLAVKKEGDISQLPLSHSGRFTVYQRRSLQLATGDKIRITKGGKTREGTRINNGDIFTVTGFTRAGHIRLHTGKILDKEFGHIAHGYVTTSHASQGKTVDRVFIAQSSQSLPAASRQQFYVSISRGREKCTLYTDDKRALEQAVKQDGQRLTAREVAEVEHRDKIIARQAKEKQPLPSSKHRHHERGKSL